MNKVIRNQIRRLRFENGEMTQRELARRSGCTRQTIHAIEAAKYGPSLELAFKIAEVFGVGVEDVFQYEAASKVKADSGRRLT
jgi:putative transcriptional regulator